MLDQALHKLKAHSLVIFQIQVIEHLKFSALKFSRIVVRNSDGSKLSFGMNNIQENGHAMNNVEIGAFQDRNQSTAWFLRGFQFENLIVSSHFCSEEGVFLLHRYRGQPHLEKPFLLRTSDLGINHN